MRVRTHRLCVYHTGNCPVRVATIKAPALKKSASHRARSLANPPHPTRPRPPSHDMAFESSPPPSTISAPQTIARPGPGVSLPARYPAPCRAGSRLALVFVVPAYNVVARITQLQPAFSVDPRDARRVGAQTLLVLNAILFTYVVLVR